MNDRNLCRIGVFYDGSYFCLAQRHLYHQEKRGWLDFRRFHLLLEAYVRAKEQGFAAHKVVYGAWFQGLHSTKQSDDKQRYRDRNQHHDLMHAGIVPKFLPMSVSLVEKGVDVALAIDAMQAAHDGKMDVAVLVTGDGDMVPLVRALMEKGIRVLVAHFNYDDGKGNRGFGSDRLLVACNYRMNINALENDSDFKTGFQSLFTRSQEDASETGGKKEVGGR